MEMDPGELDRFYPLLRHGGDAALDTFLERLLQRGISENRVLLDLLHPAAGRLGEEWDLDRCTFLEVAVGAGRLQRLVRSLTRRDHLRMAPPREERPRVLLAASSQQQHTLGLLMVAEFFRKARWRVDIGAPLRPEPASDRVRDQHFHVVGLSIPLLESVAMVRREVQRIRHRSRNPEIGVLVGGIAVATHPELVDEVGADAAAPDAHLAPDVAEAFI
jgi:MerR family transcriptional regulator, light-induced transcriptional regulator